MKKSDLLVATAYNNFRQFKSRVRLTRQWLDEVQDSGATIALVEFALGDRPFEFSQEEYPHIKLYQLRGDSNYEIWLRDAQIMVAFDANPNFKYFCWQDADVSHRNNDWVMDTLHMLQHNRVGQTWSNSYDLNAKGNIARNEWGNDVDRSFCAAWLAGDIDLPDGPYGSTFCRSLLDPNKPKDYRSHTGYSWAIRRDALHGIERLLDWMITGSSDWHMALGFCGKLRYEIEKERANENRIYGDSYYLRLLDFADKCEKYVKQDIGVVDGTIAHYWHGSKKTRFYGQREKILQEGKFDPDLHLAQDPHGLPYLINDNRILRDGMRRLNLLRNEDSIDE